VISLHWYIRIFQRFFNGLKHEMYDFFNIDNKTENKRNYRIQNDAEKIIIKHHLI